MSRLYNKNCRKRSLYVNVNDKVYEIGSFVFYNNEGVVVKHDRGYFESDVQPVFDFEIIRKVKESFNKKIAYILKSKIGSIEKYDLYIHVDLVGLQNKGYKIEQDFIFSVWETNIKCLSFDVYEKSLKDNLYRIKNKIEDETRRLIYPDLTSEDFQECINRLQLLQLEFKKEEKMIKNYSVETYMNEIKIS